MQKPKYKIVPLSQTNTAMRCMEYHAEGRDIATFLRRVINDIIRELPGLNGEEILDLLEEFRRAVQDDIEYERLISVCDGVLTATYALHHPLKNYFQEEKGIRRGFQLRYDPTTRESIFRPIAQMERQKRIRYRLRFLELPVAIDCSTQEGKNTVLSKILCYAAQDCPAQCSLAVGIVDEISNAVDKGYSCRKLIYTKDNQIAKADILMKNGWMIVSNLLKKDWWVMDREGVRLLEYSSEDRTVTIRRIIVEGPLLSVRGIDHVCFCSQRKYARK